MKEAEARGRERQRGEIESEPSDLGGGGWWVYGGFVEDVAKAIPPKLICRIAHNACVQTRQSEAPQQ